MKFIEIFVKTSQKFSWSINCVTHNRRSCLSGCKITIIVYKFHVDVFILHTPDDRFDFYKFFIHLLHHHVYWDWMWWWRKKKKKFGQGHGFLLGITTQPDDFLEFCFSFGRVKGGKTIWSECRCRKGTKKKHY